jgi:tetraprenyl-beta-curcumene synthase
MIHTMMPAVRRELKGWRRLASRIPDAELRAQALASIDQKEFHCLGGGVYALYPGADFGATLKFIVAFQTISDYLDNLCDRAGVLDAEAFRQLHLSMADAADPDAKQHDYYAYYPHNDDGGYLAALTEECRAMMRRLPAYAAVHGEMLRLVSRYSELQALKHMEPSLREETLKRWAGPLATEYPGISVWEFCAAAGSTLGVFLLFAAAQHPRLTPASTASLLEAYFPWVCGLHILLDYFIDAEEDLRENDLNFTGYYRDARECAEKLASFARRALSVCLGLPYPGFHKTIVHGLLAMYLSDPKAESERNRRISGQIRSSGGAGTALYHRICRILRARGML